MVGRKAAARMEWNRAKSLAERARVEWESPRCRYFRGRLGVVALVAAAFGAPMIARSRIERRSCKEY